MLQKSYVFQVIFLYSRTPSPVLEAEKVGEKAMFASQVPAQASQLQVAIASR